MIIYIVVFVFWDFGLDMIPFCLVLGVIDQFELGNT